jgi:hypothetical protein
LLIELKTLTVSGGMRAEAIVLDCRCDASLGSWLYYRLCLIHLREGILRMSRRIHWSRSDIDLLNLLRWIVSLITSLTHGRVRCLMLNLLSLSLLVNGL